MESHKDVLIWLKSVSKKYGLPKRLNYKNMSLWWFNEFPLSVFIADILSGKRRKSSYNTFKRYLYKLPFLIILYFLVKRLKQSGHGGDHIEGQLGTVFN